MANVRDVSPQKLLQSPGRFGAWLAGDLLGGAELEAAHSAMGGTCSLELLLFLYAAEAPKTTICVF